MEESSKNEALLELDSHLEELVDELVSDLKEGDQSEMESFESYVHRVRQELMEDMTVFKDQFLSGYEEILAELVKKYDTLESEGEPPSDAMKL